MFDWGSLNIEQVANGLLIVILGVLSYLGIRGGRRQQQHEDTTTGVIAGALVDSTSIKMLCNSIDVFRNSLEGNSKANGYRLESMTSEIKELRRSVDDLANQIARKH